MSDGLSYADAGVDLDAAERTKEGLKELVASTRDRFTLSELGAFGGLYQVPDDVDVRRVDLATELQILTFHQRQRSLAPPESPVEGAS